MDTQIAATPSAAAEHLTFGGGARSWFSGLKWGLRGRCPNCHAKTLFTAYLKMAPACSACGQTFEPYRADDAPAYFTILIVGHLVVPMVLIVEQLWTPPLWLHSAIWIPLTLVLALVLLPRCKGSIIGLQWGLDVRPAEAGPERV